MEFTLKDSGQREQFETGSRRDVRKGKGRFDLISPYFLKRLALVLERGAEKYGERNWELGQPLGRYLDSALRHITQVLKGDTDEDHAAQAAWNLHSFIHTAERIEQGKLPRTLDDIGYVPVNAEFEVLEPKSDVADGPAAGGPAPLATSDKPERSTVAKCLAAMIGPGWAFAPTVISQMVEDGFSSTEVLQAKIELDLEVGSCNGWFPCWRLP